jgi:hypothetical protein
VFVLHGVDDARSKVGADGVHASECTNLNQFANRCDSKLETTFIQTPGHRSSQ